MGHTWTETMAYSMWTVLYRVLEPGANLHPLECLLVYLSPLWFLVLEGALGEQLLTLAKWNFLCQLTLFVVFVHVPAFLTGHMSYVDIGWPCGLCMLAINTFLYSHGGNDTRTALVCGALLFHGGRMFMGAMALFYPYRFKEDLSRYQYARKRFIQETDKPGLWWIKQQQDIFGQCGANSVILAVPVMMVANNPSPEIHWLELLGFCCWVMSWCLENLADIQMNLFVGDAKKQGDIRTAVLGHPPYNNKMKYGLWTLCRHPNYFFEWCCWNSFCLMALPSALALAQDPSQGIPAKAGIFVLLYCTSRFFYDCLVHWTGAAPAESRSVQRRSAFKAYQASTNVLFPFPMPFIDHHRTPGWPTHAAMD